ncbi:MAG TPA: DUF5684 domain-containing protein [Ignavibacteria bacterium]|nr:DUF5684 domain-containing protein [Ignavibacteria bacterium]
MEKILLIFNYLNLLFFQRDDYEYDTGPAGIFAGGVVLVIYLAVIIVILAAYWKIFVKAGRPGWEGIIPIYNWFKLMDIIGRPVWWVILLLIPCVNIIVLFIVSVDLAKSFGKDMIWGVGIFLIPVIFLPVLAFGDAQYVGPSAKGNEIKMS